MTTLRYLGADALRDALPMSAAVEAIEAIMRAASAGDAVAPARTVQSIPRRGREDCVFLVMPGTWGERGADEDHRSFRWTWLERGGPPIEKEPAPGLGTALIEGFIGSDLQGRVELRFPRSGADHEFSMSFAEYPTGTAAGTAGR